MIKFKDYTEAKRNFKSVMNKDVSDFICIQINPKEEYIRFASHDRFNNLREVKIPIEVDMFEFDKKKVTISSISKLDCIWDLIWYKDGFYYETYPKAYSDIETRSLNHGTKYDICQVVLCTKKKRYVYTTLQCDSIKAIE